MRINLNCVALAPMKPPRIIDNINKLDIIEKEKNEKTGKRLDIKI